MLGVNIDHIATLRNARGTACPIRCRQRLLLAGGSERRYRALREIAATLLTVMCASCIRHWIPA
ncbi:pyridoxine 5'-phosphate synthase [Escherichia coli]